MAVVGLPDQQDASEQRPQDRVDDTGRQHEADDQPDDDPGQRDHFRQQVMFEIDRKSATNAQGKGHSHIIAAPNPPNSHSAGGTSAS